MSITIRMVDIIGSIINKKRNTRSVDNIVPFIIMLKKYITPNIVDVNNKASNYDFAKSIGESPAPYICIIPNTVIK